MKKWVYIDYENMSGLKSLPKIDGQYFLFVGATQNTLTKTLVLSAQENNGKFIEISGNGKNALDFHIAYQLGEDIKGNSGNDIQYYIVSKDCGYDPLVTFIKKKIGNRIFRIVSLNDLLEKEDSTKKVISPLKNNDSLQKVKKHLKDIRKSIRPKSEKKLTADIQSLLRADNPSEKDIQSIIEELYRTGFISKSNKTITYSE